MPRLPQQTAESRGNVLSLPSVGADTFGARAGREMQQAGKEFEAIGAKIQDNKDKLDTVKAFNDYQLRLDGAKTRIADTPDLDKHEELLTQAHQEISDDILAKNPSMSGNARRAFLIHADNTLVGKTIDLRHQGHERAIQQQIVDVTERGKTLAVQQGQTSPTEGLSRDAGHVPGQVRATAQHLLRSFSENGSIHPEIAKKVGEQWSNVFWEERANKFPEYTKDVIESGKLGSEDFPMDPHKATYYGNLAQAQINAKQKAADEQAKMVKDETEKSILSQMWGGGNGTFEARDVAPDIEESRSILSPDEYQKLMTENRQVQHARNEMVNESRTTLSQYTQSDLLEKARRAKYDPALLRSIVNNNVVRNHVFNKKDLLPDDAAPIYAAISEAIGYQEQGESPLRKAQTDAMRSLNVYVPRTAIPADAFALNNIQDSMQRQLRVEMEAKPNATPVEIHQLADTIRAQGEQRVLGHQKLNAQRVDEELMGMERHWQAFDPEITGTNHDIKPDKRKKMEQQFPMLKGLFKLHDARRERWEQLTKIGQDQADRSAKGKK